MCAGAGPSRPAVTCVHVRMCPTRRARGGCKINQSSNKENAKSSQKRAAVCRARERGTDLAEAVRGTHGGTRNHWLIRESLESAGALIIPNSFSWDLVWRHDDSERASSEGERLSRDLASRNQPGRALASRPGGCDGRGGACSNSAGAGDSVYRPGAVGSLCRAVESRICCMSLSLLASAA